EHVRAGDDPARAGRRHPAQVDAQVLASLRTGGLASTRTSTAGGTWSGCVAGAAAWAGGAVGSGDGAASAAASGPTSTPACTASAAGEGEPALTVPVVLPPPGGPAGDCRRGRRAAAAREVP